MKKRILSIILAVIMLVTMLPAYTIPSFAETSGDTPIESMVLTPVRELIVGIDSLDYQEYLDFSAKIKFKDGTTKECLVLRQRTFLRLRRD